MDFRLRVFLSVVDNLSFTKAAKEMGISQPAITKHIQELEAEYGVKLFDRRSGSIFLTDYGITMEKYAKRIVLEHRLLRQEMALPSSAVSGELKICADTPSAGVLIQDVIPGFFERFPSIGVSLSVPFVEKGDFDAAFTMDGGKMKIRYRKESSSLVPVFISYLEIYLARIGVGLSI